MLKTVNNNYRFPTVFTSAVSRTNST